MTTIEQKTLIGRIEVKLATDATTKEKSFSGYGAHFNNVDAYGDVIVPGAFAKTLAEHKAAGTSPAMLWNHDSYAMPIGIWDDLKEDESGLKASGRLVDTETGQDAYTLLKAGAVTGLSIGYIVTGSEMNGKSRHITEVKLFEISVVTFPANTLARVNDVKSADHSSLLHSIEELEAKIADLRSAIDIKADEVAPTDESKDTGEDQFGDECDCEEDDDCECDKSEIEADDEESKADDLSVLMAMNAILRAIKASSR